MILTALYACVDEEVVERYKGGFVRRFLQQQECVTWPYSTIMRGEIRNSAVRQFEIQFSDRYLSSHIVPAVIRWPFDIAHFIALRDTDSKLFILDGVHAASLAMAAHWGWPTGGFERAYEQLRLSRCHHIFRSKRKWKCRGIGTVRIAVTMELGFVLSYFDVKPIGQPDLLIPLAKHSTYPDFENTLAKRIRKVGESTFEITGRDGAVQVDLRTALVNAHDSLLFPRL